MQKFDFNIGAAVHCKSGKCGKLEKLVVDPETMEVTNLIVQQGFILTADRVVPVANVDQAYGDYVMLSITATELENYPEYHFFNFDVVSQNSHKKTVGAPYIVPHATPFGFNPTGRFVPIFHRRDVHANVQNDHKVISGGMPVHSNGKKIGTVDRLLVDAGSGELTHLVVDRGRLSDALIFPITTTEGIAGERIDVNIDDDR